MTNNNKEFMWRARALNPRTGTWGSRGFKHGFISAVNIIEATRKVSKGLNGNYRLEFFVPRSACVK